ncbi:MAG: acetyl/propionyl/methylcrotonyl-CoA carboxylase subunit alpha [Rhizobiales bacterium]|nr:acetyl/propionyl/methylcrotonyl-CoA carboxylase subunit alpha [Hyphomicrobiales bacterium]
MFASVLIANRGEIAVRIARTARRLGMRTIAVYSEADRNALHVRCCDEAHAIGPSPARASYLVIERLIEAARLSKADCIHPGYGFLSENPAFAEACAVAGIVFVGPPPEAIRAMGLKDRAKALMEQAGIPIVPGYHGDRQESGFLKQKAYEIGYPVLIKPSAGGGGKGMRRVDKHAEFDEALQSAMREAYSAFGDRRVLIEKFVTAPRHIEIQIFADGHGNVVHLNERDCSLQRRHQKVIEEAPAPGMTDELRAIMGRAAIAAAKAVGYIGAGTVEFIVDGTGALRSDGFWFMEMNTRLQVEHPVTEAVTGLDLVEWQFRIAAGESLPLPQKKIALDGHAIEARIYAEDPERGFLPSTGKILALDLPVGEGIRIDRGIDVGGEVTSHYDPMIGKVIAHGRTRAHALDRLAGALDRTAIAGPRTNLAFLSALCRDDDFRSGRFDTGFIDRNMGALGAIPREVDTAAAALGARNLIKRENARIHALVDRDEDTPLSPWDATDAFQLSGPRMLAVPIVVDGKPMAAQMTYGGAEPALTVGDTEPDLNALTIEAADAVHVLRHGRQTVVRLADMSSIDFDHADGDGSVRAPMHGKVLALLVEKGEKVAKGHRVAVIEAMKMEHALVAPCDGVVATIAVRAGSQIAEGAKVLIIEPESND